MWKKTFESYKALKGSYPDMANGGYCLGYGFLQSGGVGKCRDYQGTGVTTYLESDAAPLMTALGEVIKIPKPSNLPANGTVGPYAEYTASIIILYTWIKGGGTTCPTEIVDQGWQDNTGNRTACTITLTR